MSKRTVRVTLAGETSEIAHGTTVGELLRERMDPPERSLLAAIVHNRCVDLETPLTAETEVVPVDYTMREGVLVYRRTASLILLEAVRQLLSGVRVTIGQSQGNGYFYGIHTPEELTTQQVQQIEQRMRELVARDLPLRCERVSLHEAREIFRALGAEDTLRLLDSWWGPEVKLVHLLGACDIHHYPVAPSTGAIKWFDLMHEPSPQMEPGGVVLRFPQRRQPEVVEPYVDEPQLLQTYREARSWLRILDIETVGQLNEVTVRGHAGELIRINEGLHEKKIAQIADYVCERSGARGNNGPVRLVLIAGPSASGKTTFSKRLALQLRVNGVSPVALSTDNFYVNREDTPLDEDGKPDFESIEAIDLDLFNDILVRLLRGEKVLTPRFDFPSGERKPRDKWRPMRLERGQVLMVEGIHGLNPRLTEAVPDTQKYKIYVSALTQLCIDGHNRIFTSDTRFLRRIVRDRMFRGYSAAETIEAWPRVRRGENRNIFGFQEQADVMFNSALVYEQAVLRLYAERFLLEVSQEQRAYVDAYRLLRFVDLFVPIFDETIPQTSLLREFIGGSFFNY